MKAKVKATGKIVDGIPIYYGSAGKVYLDVPVDHDIFDRYDLEEVELLEQPSLPDGLEEAARHSEMLTYPMPEDGDIEKVMKVQEARIFHEIGFLAGAEWMKAKMLKGAVECYYGYVNNCTKVFLPEETLKGIKEGYVKIVILKNNECSD